MAARRAWGATFAAALLAACTLALPGAAPRATGADPGTVEVTTLADPAAPAASSDQTTGSRPQAMAEEGQTPEPPPPGTAAGSAGAAAVPAAGDAAAAPAPPAPAAAPAADAPAADASAAVPDSPEARACLRRGGIWTVLARSGLGVCQNRTRDAMRACRRGTDCQGDCLARSGTCAPAVPMFGCNDILDDLGRRVRQCLD